MTKIPDAYRCTICDKPRDRDFNHWRLMWKTDDKKIIVSHWSEDIAKESVEHLCGQSCAITLFSKWMQITVDKKPV